jgi:transposase-like protein
MLVLPAGCEAVEEGTATAAPLSTEAAAIFEHILEQDHRAIKRRVKASQGFRSFWGAWRTIAGYEAVNMMRKGQAKRVGKGELERQLCLIAALFSLTR